MIFRNSAVYSLNRRLILDGRWETDVGRRLSLRASKCRPAGLGIGIRLGREGGFKA